MICIHELKIIVLGRVPRKILGVVLAFLVRIRRVKFVIVNFTGFILTENTFTVAVFILFKISPVVVVISPLVSFMEVEVSRVKIEKRKIQPRA